MSSLRILVAIANYGSGNRRHVEKLIESYRGMPFDVEVVVLSNVPKDLGRDVRVEVGLPSRDPWSLPFAHRRLFAAHQDDFDLFIYSEDDTLIRQRNIEAFLDVERVLGDHRIAGFLRTEEDEQGRRSVSTVHSFFRWVPDSLFEVGGRSFARFSNDHGACFMLTRRQLEKAIRSGGFVVEPHEGRYDMLCSAATDPYCRCGLERVVNIDDLDSFLLPHLSGRYIGKFGLSIEEVKHQLDALAAVERGALPGRSLFEPETRMPHGRFSKDLYARPTSELRALVPPDAGRILSIGCGAGCVEEPWIREGRTVLGIPVDAIIGASAASRGLEVLYSDLAGVHERIGDRRFDVILLHEVLHLVPDPLSVVQGARRCLSPGGVLAVQVPNVTTPGTLRRKWRGDQGYRDIGSFERTGLHASGPGWLERLLEAGGFTVRRLSVRPRRDGRRRTGRIDGFIRRCAPGCFASEVLGLAEARVKSSRSGRRREGRLHEVSGPLRSIRGFFTRR